MVTTDYMLEAYFDCRKKKRRTASAAEYEMDYESRLISLRDRINNRAYSPGVSICFVASRPRFREVFAASFEDRIVHHYIALRLEPLFEEVFNDRTFNCRKGKGQLYGINMLQNDIRECSNNYSADCYIMKIDLKGFFMSINKSLLAKMINDFIVERYKGEDKEDLRYLCNIVIMHQPEKNCERHSPIEYWNKLTADKSLFTCGEGRGVAIGNLFAQLFANYFLNSFDWLLEKLGVKYHGRYVDDIYFIHRDKKFLLDCMKDIRGKLSELGLRLNEKKFYMQHYSKGVKFTGAVSKVGRLYAVNTTVTNFVNSVKRLNQFADAGNLVNLKKAVSSVNSYLGILRHYNEYATRRRVLNTLDSNAYMYVFIKGKFEVVALKNEYKWA